MMNKNEIVDLSFDFAIQIVSYCDVLEQNRKFVVSNQLLRSGTSIGANVREAQNAESILDFLHKMKIAAKETEETEYWLLICNNSKNYPSSTELLSKVGSLKKLFSKIISSTKKKIIEKK